MTVDLLEVGQQARLRVLVLLQEHDLKLKKRKNSLKLGITHRLRRKHHETNCLDVPTSMITCGIQVILK